MATSAGSKAVGTVSFVSGEARAIAADGTSRLLQVGDRVFSHEVITTSANAAVQIHLENGSLFDLTHDSRVVLDDAVLSARATGAPAAGAPLDAEELHAAIPAGADPAQVAAASSADQDVPAERSGDHAPLVVEQANTAGEVPSASTVESTSVTASVPEPEVREAQQPQFLVQDTLSFPVPGSRPAASVQTQAELNPSHESPVTDHPSPITSHEFVAGSDRLDPSELLQGAANPNDVTAYLSFTYDAHTNATTVNVQPSSPGALDQKIVLMGVDLTAGGTLSTDTIIQNLLTHVSLHTEV